MLLFHVFPRHTNPSHRWYVTRGTAVVDVLAIGPLPLELALWLHPSAPHGWSAALPVALMLRLARLVHVWRFLMDAQFNGVQLYRGFGLYSVVSSSTLLLANLAFTTATVVRSNGCGDTSAASCCCCCLACNTQSISMMHVVDCALSEDCAVVVVVVVLLLMRCSEKVNFLGSLWVWTAHMEGTADSWLTDVGALVDEMHVDRICVDQGVDASKHIVWVIDRGARPERCTSTCAMAGGGLFCADYRVFNWLR